MNSVYELARIDCGNLFARAVTRYSYFARLERLLCKHSGGMTLWQDKRKTASTLTSIWPQMC